MSKIIINGKSDGGLKTYCNGNEIEGVMAGGSLAYRKIETGTPEPPAEPSYLCFTAQEAGSTVAFQKTSNPVIVPVLYTSTDGNNWSSWDGSAITLANIGDKVYVYGENSCFCDQPSSSTSAPTKYWKYVMTGRIAASGDVTSMLTKNGTTTLDNYALLRMFQGCTALTQAPALPATTLANFCYYYMFSGCTSLTTAPELPATTLADSCYNSMFNRCTAITTAPALPATTLASSCYSSMFNGCTSLTTAPALQATTLAGSCYYWMFNRCTAITTAPALPATTLAQNCYANMFYGCTSLTTAPELPATTLADSCYNSMFYGCTSLNYIEVSATGWNETYTSNWVRNVAATGTFVNNEGIAIPVSVNGIPSGWTEVGPRSITISGAGDTGYTYQIDSGQPQTVTAGSGDVAVKVHDGSSITLTSSSASSLIYSDNHELGTMVTIPFADIVKGSRIECWVPDTNYLCLTANEANSTISLAKQGTGAIEHALYISTDGTNWSQWDYSTVTLANIGDKLYVKGDGNKSLRGTSTNKYYYFTMGGSIAASGDVTTLLTTKPQPQMVTHTFEYLFKNCTSLTTAPALPATTLANFCYYYMFSGCTSLTTAPALTATTLASSCYSNMFNGCTAITTAPALPATTLAQNCYTNMFYGCTALNSVKCLAENISAFNCTSNWLQNVSATGTFTKSANMSSWTTGSDGIPEGWTVEEV